MPGTKPAVYVGSYDGNFFALDARNGKELWTHNAGGKISGSATVVGKVVCFANLGASRPAASTSRTGKRVFKYGRGSFTPVIADGRRIYLTGYHQTLYGLVPKEALRRRSSAKRGRRSGPTAEEAERSGG